VQVLGVLNTNSNSRGAAASRATDIVHNCKHGGCFQQQALLRINHARLTNIDAESRRVEESNIAHQEGTKAGRQVKRAGAYGIKIPAREWHNTRRAAS
jgi:hypothetical protein